VHNLRLIAREGTAAPDRAHAFDNWMVTGVRMAPPTG
jgi:aromatic ring-opening dioxygenase catalytic subunit (LigB family)